MPSSRHRRWTRAPRALLIALAVLIAVAARARARAAPPFTIVALPDTQYYTGADDRNNVYFKGQTHWIVNHRAAHNIAFTLHLGDIQNLGNPYYDDGTPTGYVRDENQWIRADAAMKILDDAKVPYSVVPGNHDYLHFDRKEEPTYYLKWFGPQRFQDKPTFGGASPYTATSRPGMNTYHLFDGGGYKFLNIALQYAPDVHDLTWAQRVINANPGLPTLVTTHAMLDTNGYQAGRENIFYQFMRNNPQVVMSMNGHVNGAYRQTETNIAGQDVHEMLVDYQSTPYPGYFDGGGYLRLLQFDTEASVVRVKSYSPVIGNYLTDSRNQFELPLNLRERFGPAAPAALGPTRVARFQQGVNGYAGTQDTQLDASVPDTIAGSNNFVWADADNNDLLAGDQPRQGLVRFDNLFGGAGGGGGGGIPSDAVITSATLTVRTNTGGASESPDPMRLYRMLVPWNESSTWNSLFEGVGADGFEAILGTNDFVVPEGIGQTVSFDVTESLFAWLSGAPNYGWVVLPGGPNGWRFDSSEHGTTTNRPFLTVTYATVPEPAMTAAAAALLLFVTHRRRRERGGGAAARPAEPFDVRDGRNA